MGGNNAITTGSGSALVYAAANNDTVVGLGNDTVNAGRGNETLNFSNNSGNDTIYGWNSVGGGTYSITASKGADLFAYIKGQTTGLTPNELISGFNGSDMVSLSGFGGTYTPGIALSGGNTVFSLSDGSQITVQNYTNWGANQFRIS